MIIQHVSQHEFWMYLMLMLHNKGTKSRKLCLNYLKITKVCRFKRTIKCISNVIYIVNNIVTSFYPSISFRAKGCTKILPLRFSSFFSKIPQHLRTYDDKDNIPLSLQLIINQKSKYYSLFNLIKVRPKQKKFKKKTSRWKFWKYLSHDFRGFSFFFCLATGFKSGFNGAIL